MYTSRPFSTGRALAWSLGIVPILGLWATALTAAHYFLGAEWLQIPTTQCRPPASRIRAAPLRAASR